MSELTLTKEKKQSSSFKPVGPDGLQRKCACGQHTPGGGECAVCKKKHEAGRAHHAAVGPTGHTPAIQGWGGGHGEAAHLPAGHTPQKHKEDILPHPVLPQEGRAAATALPGRPIPSGDGAQQKHAPETARPPAVRPIRHVPTLQDRLNAGAAKVPPKRAEERTSHSAVQKEGRTPIIQTKRDMPSASDPYEREADRIARQILSLPESVSTRPVAITRLTGDNRQTGGSETSAGSALSDQERAAVETQIQSMRGEGAPLDSATRAAYERRLGYDLSAIRLHTDARAARASSALRAQAFAVGNDIFFAAGRYQPTSFAGNSLLAHELVHTLQQSPAPRPATFKARSGPAPLAPTPDPPAPRAPLPSRRIIQRLADSEPEKAGATPNVLWDPLERAKFELTKQADRDKAESDRSAPKLRQGMNRSDGRDSPSVPASDPKSPVSTATPPANTQLPGKSAPGAAARPEKGIEASKRHAGGAHKGEKGDAKEKTPESAGADKDEPAGASAEATKGAPGGAVGSPQSPADDPAFQAVKGRAKRVAGQQKAHGPATGAASAAQAAARGPANEVQSKAAGAQVDKMGRAKPKPFNAAAFKATLLAKIAAAAPKNLKQADEFKKDNKVAGLKGDLQGQVKESKEQSQGDVAEKAKETPATAGIEPKPVTPLPPQEAGPPPPALGAADAAPKPKTAAEISMQEGSHALDQQMTDAQITEEQLKKSNEPQFQTALEAKKTAQADAVSAPLAYQKAEKVALSGAQKAATSTAQSQALGMHGARGKLLAQVGGKQDAAKVEDEKKRAAVSKNIQSLYEATKKKVEDRLATLETAVSADFDAGAQAAQKAFTDYVDSRMSSWKMERYLLKVGGSLLWLKDQLFDLPEEVNRFYEEGRRQYLASMDKVIDGIATKVADGLNEAMGLIATGKQEVETYVTGLEPSLQEVGKQAAEKIQTQFDTLEQSVTDKLEQLGDTLSQKYVEALKTVDADIAARQEANKGLVTQGKEALKGVWDTLVGLKNMLLNVLSRAADAIGLILAHPIDFLGNLVAGVKQGFMNFVGKIGEHLKKGLLSWLFGALADAGIQLPTTFDTKGIISLILQILGLTYANFRARAVTILGEKVVKALETAAEIFKILITKGPAGLLDFLKEKLEEIKTTVIDQIKSFVMEKIITAGITWIIGLLNPASAFIKACKAIYDIVMFFVERGSQILALVNAVIDSVTAIAKGNIAGAAKFIEESLAKAVPVLIGFLASLLGVGGISEKIKSIIEKIRKPINAAIDVLIKGAVKLVKAVGSLFGGKGKDKKDDKPDADPEHTAKVNAGLAEIDQEDQKREKEGKITREDAESVAAKVKKDHPVFKSITVVDGVDSWDYDYVASPGQKKKGGAKSDVDAKDLGKAKAALGTHLFTRDKLAGVLENMTKPTALRRIAAWKEKGVLFTLASAPSDVGTQYSFDKAKAGQRPTDPNNRAKYGYANPKKTSSVGLIILSKGVRSDSPSPIQLDSSTYHQTQARYRSTRQPSTYPNFGFAEAVLGHAEPGASDHWKQIGHTQTKAQNIAWNHDPAHYRGPEHKTESAASGAGSERYIVPSEAAGSHSDWW